MPAPKETVLITGCSAGGIGDELARQYHAKGLRVIATARTLSSMKGLEELGIETRILDVTDTHTIDSVKARITELTGGKLDILINNAGAALPYAATDVSMADVKALFDVNLFGPMTMVQKFVDFLIASGNGRIVQIGSLAGVVPVPFSVAYNASKAALHSYGDSLRVELAPFNIQVTTVVAGYVSTNITKPGSHKLPPNSLYQPIRDIYQARRINNFEKASPRDKVVKSIVDETLTQRPRAWLWVGANSWLVWFISTFCGRRGFDALISNMFGLTKLASLLKKAKQN